jgi:predicted secreted protein
MATHLGKDGVVKVSTHAVAEVRSWTLNEAADVVDASVIGDDWKVQKTTLKSWHGTLTCFWDETDTTGQVALAVGASVTLNLYPEGETDGSTYFTGTALVTGVDVSAAHNGLVEANIVFQGTGALTISTVDV